MTSRKSLKKTNNYNYEKVLSIYIRRAHVYSH